MTHPSLVLTCVIAIFAGCLGSWLIDFGLSTDRKGGVIAIMAGFFLVAGATVLFCEGLL